MLKAKHAWQLAGLLGPAAQSPVVRLSVRYWPVAAIVGYAMWQRYKERRSKDEATVYNLLADAGTIVGPWAALIAIGEFAQRKERQEAGVAPVKAQPAPSKDMTAAAASYSPPQLPVHA